MLNPCMPFKKIMGFKVRPLGQKGQSSVEFLMVASIFIFFVFLHIMLSVVFMGSSYIDYSVFMAGRAGSSVAQDKGTQAQNFLKVLGTYLRTDRQALGERVDAQNSFLSPYLIFRDDSLRPIRGPQVLDAEGLEGNSNLSRNVQIGIDYSHMFFLGTFLMPNDNLTHVKRAGSSHFYRRDPSVEECTRTMDKIINRFGLNNNDSRMLYDNGC